MLKKTLLFLIFLIATLTASDISLANPDYWVNSDGNNRWTDPNNWQYWDSVSNSWIPKLPETLPGLVNPTLDDALIIQPCYSGRSGPVFNANDGTQSPYFVVVGYGGCNGEMWMNGGTIKAPWGFTFNKNGDASSNSVMYMEGGLLYLGPWPGYGGVGNQSNGFLGIGRRGTATFNMTGGTIECVSFGIPESGQSDVNTVGIFNLNGGVVNADYLYISPAGPRGANYLNLTGGRLTLSGDQTFTVNSYVKSGSIVAYPGYTGRRLINVDYDNYASGKTTVTASWTTLKQAWKPVPMDTYPNAEPSVVLGWSIGDGAVSHKLYLGLDFNDVNDGIADSVTTDVNSYNPDGLMFGQTYYWRVDEFDGSATYKGVVWSFTIVYDPFALNPHPGDGTKGIAPNTDLIWTAGDKAIAHDVYFGTSYSDVNSANNPNVLPGRGQQVANSYNPGTLILGQEYYWRIDEFDGNDVYKGSIWSFDVASSFASRPNPINGGGYVARDVVLSWLAGYGAISHDVYIGTNSNDVNSAVTPIATTSQTTFNPGGLQLGQIYYWRIDEFDGANKHKGVVWNFTTEPIGSVRAFPGAEGYGAYSRGGRGGDVYHVTNLTDDKDNPIPGSLRYGINTATGPRTIVFDVSGYIDLAYRLEISKSYLTIAGQTAPDEGITIRHWDIRLYQADNIIIRFLRVRPGYFADQVPVINIPPGQPGHLPGGLDCLSIEGSTNVIIDHCSLSWGADEVSSVTGDSNNVTVQWCTMTEPLNWNGHSKASLLRPAMTSRLSHHHNLYADSMMRTTRFGNYNNNVNTRFDWYNNVVFNWGNECTYSGNNDYLWDYVIREAGSDGNDGEFVELNFMDNYFIAGPSTTWNKAYKGDSVTNDKVWASGNVIDLDVNADINGIDTGWDMIAGSYTQMSDAFSIESPYMWESVQSAYQRVLAEAGYSYVRDSVDERIISQVKACVGSIPNTQDDVGGWSDIPAALRRPADFDTDGDGMPDSWEISHGLDPNNANDGNSLAADGSGYTNLEEYLNYLAQLMINKTPWKFGTYDALKNKSITVNDANGAIVTFSLIGGGWGQIIDDSNNFDQIVLHDTTVKSVFTIKTAKGQKTSVGDILVYGSLKSIAAAAVSLRGSIAIDGSISQLQMDDAKGGSAITIGPSLNPRAGVIMKFDDVNDLRIDSNTPITLLTCTRWLDSDASGDYIKAPLLGTLQVNGDKKRGMVGDFQADLILTGGSAKNAALTNAKIAGGVNNHTWDISGDAKTISVSGQINNWNLYVKNKISSLKLGRVSTCSIDADVITALQATCWLGGDIDANSINSLKVSGDKKAGVRGDFGANITLTGQGVAVNKNTLGNAQIASKVLGGTWDVTGNAGSIQVGSSPIGNGWVSVFSGSVGSLKATGYTDVNGVKVAGVLSGNWSSKSLKSVSINGNVMYANVAVSQAIDPKIAAIGSMAVTGWIERSRITSAGNIGSITTGGMQNSSCFAGITGSDGNADGVWDLPGLVDPNSLGGASISAFTVKGIKNAEYCFINSNIVARRLNSVLLTWPQYDNNDVTFGVAADSIKKATVKDANGILSYSNLDDPNDLKPRAGDFLIRVR